MTLLSDQSGEDPRLQVCALRDREALRRLQDRIRRRQAAGQPVDRDRQRFEGRLTASLEFVARRAGRVPEAVIAADLPIAARAGDIADAGRAHPVIIVAGATGSGKTTQLPKVLLQQGYGRRGMIGCTQPRRLAATAVAARVADELGDVDRRLVGYQVRFDNRTSPDTLIKFMTDGILLAETQADPLLLAYDALIIDEAHERSLNIDFLLGYLRRILPRRPDLRLIISSATLDVDRFAAFFDQAPVVRVEGRTYPVEVRYRPPASDDFDVAEETADAVSEVLAIEPHGDLLVFLPGERDIREAAQALEGRWGEAIAILPLYGRLPPEQQRKVFQVGGRRRVILSTNVAETSVTVPGIRVVVDTGLARIRRYHHRTQVEKLHVEPISLASAEQRKGRCGRIGPGICLRLFAESDLARRPRFTDPEIKRSSLASVILTMLDLGLGDVDDFPFLDPPKAALIRDGYRELYELGAIDAGRALTALGRTLARFPIEPRLSRVLAEAAKNDLLRDALTVVAALAVDDPRLRPSGQEAAADAAQDAFREAGSDFRLFLRLWDALPDSRPGPASPRRLRTFCRRHFLSYRRVEEWQSVRDQLEEICRQAGLAISARRADDAALHRTLLAGFVSRIGVRRESGGYRGARDIRFAIHPRSCLAAASPQWIVATEFVETSRLFASTVGPIKPAWVEALAGHLVDREFGPPFWDAATGFVRAEETVRLYGLTIVQDRKRHFGPIDPAASRALFLRHALVYGELRPALDVVRRNQERIERIAEWEARTRRMDILVSEEHLEALYDQRVPPGICSARDLRRWIRDAGAAAEQALTLTEADIVLRPVDDRELEGFPDGLDLPDGRLPLTYAYAPGEPEDGITCTVPAWALPSLPASRFDWLVPGRLREKMEFLIKGLPKRYRKELVPTPPVVDAAMNELNPSQGPLREALSEWLRRSRGVAIPVEAWPADLPDHLRLRFKVVGEDGTVVAAGRELPALARAAGSVPDRPPGPRAWDREGVTEWDFGELPRQVDGGGEEWSIPRYPAIVDQGRSVALRLFAHPFEARRAMVWGVARLTLLALPSDRRKLQAAAELPAAALLDQVALGLGGAALPDQIALRAVAETCRFFDDDVPRDADAFMERIYSAKRGFVDAAHAVRKDTEAVLARAAELIQGLATNPTAAARDMLRQVQGLVDRRFVLDTPPDYWPELSRYLRAVAVRLERRRLSAAKDDRKAEALAPFLDRPCPLQGDPEAWETYRWMLEEWRVSLFSQELGTLYPVSAKRLEAQWAAVAGAATGAAGSPRSGLSAAVPAATSLGAPPIRHGGGR